MDRYNDHLDRLERLAALRLDPKELRLRLIRELRTAVGFDAFAWLMIDPLSLVGTAPLVDVPIPPPFAAHVPDYIRSKYLTVVNRWTVLTSRPQPVATLIEATGGDLSRSRMWREVQQQLGVIDVATVVFRDRFGCWANLDLWRIHPTPAFGIAETQFLEAAATPITAGLRAALARTFAEYQPGSSQPAPAVLILGPDLRLRSQTAVAAERVLALNPPDPADPAAPPPIPAGALNVAAQLLAREAQVDDHPAIARVHLPGGHWLTVKADRLGEGPASDIAVTIEETASAERVELFARCHGLSPRQNDILRQVVAGHDSKTIAANLYLSEHTVHDHVKSVLAKSGSKTRQVLISRALGAD